MMQVVADALGDSMQVALIAGTNSDCAEDVIASIQRQLGKDLSSKIRIFSCNPARGEGMLCVIDNIYSAVFLY